MNVIRYIMMALKHRTDPLYIHYLAGRRILDIGAGRGEFVAKDPERFVGVELDQKLVAECHKKGLTVYQMNALDLDFPDETFEGVHAAQLIEHFSPSDAATFLKNVSRVLKPNGIVYLTTPGCRTVWNTFSHVRPYPPQAFLKLLNSATENYLRASNIELKLEQYWGNRFYFASRHLTLLFRVVDLLIPPKDPIGWTIVLRKNK